MNWLDLNDQKVSKLSWHIFLLGLNDEVIKFHIQKFKCQLQCDIKLQKILLSLFNAIAQELPGRSVEANNQDARS